MNHFDGRKEAGGQCTNQIKINIRKDTRNVIPAKGCVFRNWTVFCKISAFSTLGFFSLWEEKRNKAREKGEEEKGGKEE